MSIFKSIVAYAIFIYMFVYIYIYNSVKLLQLELVVNTISVSPNLCLFMMMAKSIPDFTSVQFSNLYLQLNKTMFHYFQFTLYDTFFSIFIFI